MNLAALWDYMQFDLEADKFRQEMSQSPKRKMLLKYSEQLKEFSATNTKIDDGIAGMDARIAELKAECERLGKLVEEHSAQLGNVEEMGEEELTEKIKPLEKLVATIENYEKELNKLIKDSAADEKRQTELKRRAAKLKQDYDTIKTEYDVEFANDKKKLAQLKARVEKEAAKLDSDDFEQYKEIKQHVTPPIAKLLNNQCTGCFMALPIGTLRDIKTAGVVRKCDNCGRILFPVEQ